VKRYLHEKVLYLHEHTQEDEHILIVPGEEDTLKADGVADLLHPLAARVEDLALPGRCSASTRSRKILEKEMPDIIESGDPYQVAWKAHRLRRCAADSGGRLLPFAFP